MEKSYTRYISEDKLPRKQYPTIEGLKTVLGTLGEKDTKARSIKFNVVTPREASRDILSRFDVVTLYS